MRGRPGEVSGPQTIALRICPTAALRRCLARAVLWALAVAASVPLGVGHAFALGNDTVFVRAFTSLNYDSNVFRVSDDFDADLLLGDRGRSDLIWGVGGGIRCDLPVSQQRFTVDASATNFSYAEFDELDYTGYALRGAWDWKVGSKWSGRLSAGARQERQSYSDSVGFFIPSLLVTTEAGAEARYALTPRWELQGAANLLRVRYDEEVREFDDFDSESLALGALYRSPGGNGTGARLTYEQGKWPNRPNAATGFFDDEYSQVTLAAVLDWRIGGRSRLSGDAGYTWRDRDDAAGRDFDGPSGRLNYDYSLSGRSTLRASLYEIRGPIEDFTATYTRTRGIDASYLYQLSGKVGLEALASYKAIDYEGESAAPSVDQREDRLTTLSLTATYQLLRKLTLAAGGRYEMRSSNVDFGDYDVYTLFASASVEF
jgi:exopolysaccharide biosynthesis operon protein EpsL